MTVSRSCLTLGVFLWAALSPGHAAERETTSPDPEASEGPLQRYVHRDDDAFGWKIHDEHNLAETRVLRVRLTSQAWRGEPWEHWLTIIRPDEIRNPRSALLLIAGGSNGNGPPALHSETAGVLREIAKATGSLTAIVQQVPNQPLFDGLYEDDLIAHTFVQYLETGEDTWPALLPMTRSAVAAMDAVQAVADEKLDLTPEAFTVTGASKRGWTTWLTAAADDRVQAIAPIVIDMLNIPPQLEAQRHAFGELSRMLDPYVERGVPSRLDEPRGRELVHIVDPFAYRRAYTMPKLLVLGTNDPYWTVDAANHYFPHLPDPTHLCYQANTGHDAERIGIATIARLHASASENRRLPHVEWDHPQDQRHRLRVEWRGAATPILWTATAETRDFRNAEWNAENLEPGNENSLEVSPDPPESGHLAYYVELRYAVDSPNPYAITTSITVLPPE